MISEGLLVIAASPELHDGMGIGLETDIFSLGVVMWEVFTRREAWHWLEDRPGKAQAIMSKVLTKNLRPKNPPGLSEECAIMVRQCLQMDPSKRPSCKEVCVWIEGQRKGLQTEIAKHRREKATEREERRRKDQNWTKKLFSDSCEITKWGAPEISKYWSDKGRFSLYKMWTSGDVMKNTSEFSIEVTPVKPDQWVEAASGTAGLDPDVAVDFPVLDQQPVDFTSASESEPEKTEPEPEPEPQPEETEQLEYGVDAADIPAANMTRIVGEAEDTEPETGPLSDDIADPSVVVASFNQSSLLTHNGKLGIVFKEKKTGDSENNSWPYVRRVEKFFETQSQAERTRDNPSGSLNKQNLVPGCRLMEINQTKIDREDGTATVMTFKEAAGLRLLRRRDLSSSRWN